MLRSLFSYVLAPSIAILVAACMIGCEQSGSSVTAVKSNAKPGVSTANSADGAGKADVGGGKKEKKVIGLSILTSANPFFVDISDAIKAKAAEQGYTVVTVSGDEDANKQQNQVKDFIVQGVAAIVLTPCDSRAIGTAIQEANAAGIPVFTADIACIAPDAKVITHIATDNYSGGRQAAQAMIEALGGTGKVGILDFPQLESVMLRTKGFREELEQQVKEKGVTLEVVSVLPGDGAKDKSFKSTQDMLQSHPEINGIFAINDPSALGCYAALENAGAQNKIKIVGFDGQIDGRRAIKEGKIYADPIQFPKRIGEETVATIFRYLEGESVPPSILIPTALYRQADGEKDAELK